MELLFLGGSIAPLLHLDANAAAAQFPHVGLMGMAAEHGFRPGCLHPFQGGKGIHVWQQIFVLTVGAAMHKQQFVAPQCHRQFGQKRLVLLGEGVGGPMVSAMATSFRQLRGITALAGIQAINDVFIPAALTGGNAPLTHQFNDFIGLWAVTDEITQAGDGFNALGIDVVKNGFDSGEVGVQAGDDGVVHDNQACCGVVGCWERSCCCCISSTSSERRQSLMVD